MRLVGLTGGIASGKSTVSAWLRESGFTVLDCDIIAREVVKPGRWGWKRLVKTFGEDILLPDRNLNRELIAEMIFRDEKLRAKLNTATHLPVFVELIKQVIIAWLQHVPILVIDMPLLFETKVEKWFSPVVLVWCDEETQRKRLMEREGCDEVTAKAKIDSQMPMELKADRATLIINNSSSKVETKIEVKAFAVALKRERIVSYGTSPIALAISFFVGIYILQYFNTLFGLSNLT